MTLWGALTEGFGVARILLKWRLDPTEARLRAIRKLKKAADDDIRKMGEALAAKDRDSLNSLLDRLRSSGL